MFFFCKRKHDVHPVDKEVEQMKQQTHEAADKANKNAQQLNRLFRKNGITLNIHIAAGGKDGH